MCACVSVAAAAAAAACSAAQGSAALSDYFGTALSGPRSGGFSHICQERSTSRDKANDAGDNAEPSQDASLLERSNVLMRLAGFHTKQRDS